MLIVFLFCYLFQALSGPVQVANANGGRAMKEDEALFVLRSGHLTSPENTLSVVDKILPTSPIAARESVDEARSRNIGLYGKGIFVALINRGGFAVLESDPKSGAAVTLHLVSRDDNDEALVQSYPVSGGNLDKNDALLIGQKSKEFSRLFLSLPASGIDSLLREFDNSKMALPGTPDEEGYLGIPAALTKFAGRPSELAELRNLNASLQLWAVRHTPWIPLFAANPSAARDLARNELLNLANQFLAERGKDPHFLHDLFYLDSIQSTEELNQRLQSLRDFNSFLEARSSFRGNSSTYEANVSISMIPLQLGVMKQGPDRLYSVMTVSGLVTVWGRTESGEFVLKGLSEGE